MAEVLKARRYCISRKRVKKIDARNEFGENLSERKSPFPGDPDVKFISLMNALKIDLPNKAWYADITYIPFEEGFGYFIAIMA